MSDSDEVPDCSYCGLFILLFILKFACALSFGLIHSNTIGGTPIFAFLTIPVAFICSVLMCNMEKDKKKAKKSYGRYFQFFSIGFIILWCMEFNHIFDLIH